MEKNKTIFVSILTVSITTMITLCTYFSFHFFARMLKHKDIIVQDSYMFCVHSVMGKLKDEDKKACSAEDVERICSKLKR